MIAILGLAIIYSWIHAVIIVNKKIKGTTKYENWVMIIALVTAIIDMWYYMGLDKSN